MDTTQKDLSYFRLKLEELLRISFPEKAFDQKFIQQRSTWAAIAYEGAFSSGNSVEQCTEIANFILFENLHFSKFDTVFRVICREFNTLVTDEELRPFALKMISVCDDVFLSYELTEDFTSSVEYDLLCTELTGTISIWIEENGLQ